jgi:hypothetical protein
MKSLLYGLVALTSTSASAMQVLECLGTDNQYSFRATLDNSNNYLNKESLREMIISDPKSGTFELKSYLAQFTIGNSIPSDYANATGVQFGGYDVGDILHSQYNIYYVFFPISSWNKQLQKFAVEGFFYYTGTREGKYFMFECSSKLSH